MPDQPASLPLSKSTIGLMGLIGLLLLMGIGCAMADSPETSKRPTEPLKVPITRGCREIGVITNDSDAAYQPGVDSDGQPVVPADLSANPDFGNNPASPPSNAKLPDKVQVGIKAPFPAAQKIPGTDPELTLGTVDVDIRPQNPTTVICPEGMEPATVRP